jgi:hypothetical protein
VGRIRQRRPVRGVRQGREALTVPPRTTRAGHVLPGDQRGVVGGTGALDRTLAIAFYYFGVLEYIMAITALLLIGTMRAVDRATFDVVSGRRVVVAVVLCVPLAALLGLVAKALVATTPYACGLCRRAALPLGGGTDFATRRPG